MCYQIIAHMLPDQILINCFDGASSHQCTNNRVYSYKIICYKKELTNLFTPSEKHLNPEMDYDMQLRENLVETRLSWDVLLLSRTYVLHAFTKYRWKHVCGILEVEVDTLEKNLVEVIERISFSVEAKLTQQGRRRTHIFGTVWRWTRTAATDRVVGKPLNWDPVEMERWPLGTVCLNFDPNVAKELSTRIGFVLLPVYRNFGEQVTRALDQILLFLSLILLRAWGTSGAKHYSKWWT